jgi:serine/threonine protein kinase
MEEVHLPGSINNDKEDQHSEPHKEHPMQAKMAFPSVEGGNKVEAHGLDDNNAVFPPCSGRGTESANSSCTRVGSATPNGRMVRELPQQPQAPSMDQSRPQSRISGAGNRERAPSRFGSKGGVADDEEQGSLDGGEGVIQGTDQFSHGGGNAQHRVASEGARRVPEKKESLSDLLGEDGKDVRWSSNPGSSLEDYIVGKQIGQGAYATVRFGIHKDTGRKVAVKVYEKYKLLDPQRRKSVRREIKLMERMSHPNMVAFHDALDTPKQIYIIMEFVGGGSLHHYLKKHTCRRVEETKAKRLFYQVCQGIKYCHDRHIVHRDVKLENLLLDENGTVKIIDFGFSTIIPPGKKLKTFCGTPSYMAPEIVARKEYSGFCADIWAMGVLLYALLCGCFPFKGQNDKDLYRKIVKGVFYIPEFVSQSSRALVTRILTVDMNRRPTVDEVLADPWFTSHPTELYALKNSHQPNVSVSSQSTTAGERTSGQTASSSSGQSASDPASAALAFPRRGSSGQEIQPSRPGSSHGMSSGSAAQVAQFGRSSPVPPSEAQQRPQSSERPQTPNGYAEASGGNSGTRASSARASREKSAKIEEEAMAKLERLGYPREEIVRQLKDESSHLYKLYFRFLKAMNAWDQK